MKKLDAIEWHDGNIEKLSFKPSSSGSNDIVLRCAVYPSLQVRERKKLKLKFQRVTSFTITCDPDTLSEHRWAGNISNGYALKGRKGEKIFWLYLSDGYMRITCRKIRLSD